MCASAGDKINNLIGILPVTCKLVKRKIISNIIEVDYNMKDDILEKYKRKGPMHVRRTLNNGPTDL